MITSQQLLHKVRSFARLPKFVQVGVLPTWILLGGARLLILSLPFKVIAPRLGHHSGIHPYIPLLAPSKKSVARSIAKLITTTAKYCPWNANCFAQAIVARIWLGLFGLPYVIFFGVKKDESDQLHAHAWTCSGPIRVTGGDSFNEFVVVSTFTSLTNLEK